MDEYFDVLDKEGKMTGIKKLRREVHRDGDWHKTIHIWIINKNGDILLQRRCANKDSHPNMLDISCAGHLTSGDDSLTGALRELKEETNLEVEVIEGYRYQIEYKLKHIKNAIKQSVYFLGYAKNDNIICQPEEVNFAKFVSFDEALKVLTFKETKDILTKAKDFLENKK